MTGKWAGSLAHGPTRLAQNQCAELAVVHQLYATEKLAALRAMAGGLAHEIGNPLAGVLALLQLAERHTEEPATRDRLRHARDELMRVGGIIRELADFTRAERGSGLIDVNPLLHEVLALARYAHEAVPVRVTLTTDPDVPILVGSRDHLLQACLYVVMNAYDAMRPEGGALTVSSERRDPDVVLRFADSGRGIDPLLRSRLFEPLFTTKNDGTGTGLGLFVCHRIVTEELGGSIGVTSRPGHGTSFELTLPIPQRRDPAP